MTTPDISIFRTIEPVDVALVDLTRDLELQPRAGLDEETVLEYKALMEGGKEFPPLWVVETPSDLLLIDGWQRDAAAARLQRGHLKARIVRGSREIAVELAAQCNMHGRSRTAADIAKVIGMLKTLPRWRQATNESIASLLQISIRAFYRAQEPSSATLADDAGGGLSSATPAEDADKPLETLEGGLPKREFGPPKLVTRDGKQFEMKTGGISRARAEERKAAALEARKAPPAEAEPEKSDDGATTMEREPRPAAELMLQWINCNPRAKIDSFKVMARSFVGDDLMEVFVHIYRHRLRDAQKLDFETRVHGPWLRAFEAGDAREEGSGSRDPSPGMVRGVIE
jgi:hypothetical protein